MRFVTAGSGGLVSTENAATCSRCIRGIMMQVPYIADRVRVRGYDAPFFVTSVDEEGQVCDLIPVTGSSPVLYKIPFVDLVRGPSTHPNSGE